MGRATEAVGCGTRHEWLWGRRCSTSEAPREGQGSAARDLSGRYGMKRRFYVRGLRRLLIAAFVMLAAATASAEIEVIETIEDGMLCRTVTFEGGGHFQPIALETGGLIPGSGMTFTSTWVTVVAPLSRPDEKSRFRRLKIPHPGCGGGFVDHHRVAKHGASRGSGGGQCWRATRQGIPGRKLSETMSAGSGGRDRSRLLFRCPTPIGSIDLPMPEKTHLPLPPLLRPGLAASAASTVGRSPD